MAKKKRKKSTDSNLLRILTYIAFGLGVIALCLATLVGGYYIGYEDGSNDVKKELRTTKNELHKQKLKSQREYSKVVDVNKKLKDILKKERESVDVIASHEYDSKLSKLPPKPVKRKAIKVVSKPKLFIIIDDVATKAQIKSIKDTGVNLTMSFLPPSKTRPNSAKLASKEKFYMVHLPMEAMHFTAEEPSTLRVSDSKAEIEKRINYIVKLFPRVKYINNHTGSKFTADELAVNKLVTVLNEKGISFVDSRTTSKTKVPLVMKNFGLKYIGRDVFLDNKADKRYIKRQIKNAVRIAKKYGTAIAIGHPHRNTLLALKESKELLKQVDLVQVYELY